MDRNKISKLISYPFPLIFHAARKENIKFLRKLADKRPDILWEVDKRKQTIFHVAVYNCRGKVLQLLSEMCSQNDPRVFLTDKNVTLYCIWLQWYKAMILMGPRPTTIPTMMGPTSSSEQLSNCNDGYAGLR